MRHSWTSPFTGPPAPQRPRAPAPLRPSVLLALTLLLAGLLAFEAQRATRSHRVTAERALRDYAAVAAHELLVSASEELDDMLAPALAPVVGSPGASPYDSLPAPATIAAALELDARLCRRRRCRAVRLRGRLPERERGDRRRARPGGPARVAEPGGAARRGTRSRLGQRTGARPGGAVSGQDDPLQRIRGPRSPARRLRCGGLPLGARGGALPGAPAPAAAPVVGHRRDTERRAGCARGVDAGRQAALACRPARRQRVRRRPGRGFRSRAHGPGGVSACRRRAAGPGRAPEPAPGTAPAARAHGRSRRDRLPAAPPGAGAGPAPRRLYQQRVARAPDSAHPDSALRRDARAGTGGR